MILKKYHFKQTFAFFILKSMILYNVKKVILLEIFEIFIFLLYFFANKHRNFIINKEKPYKKINLTQGQFRLTQKKHNDGMIYFVQSSSSWNHLPELPKDVLEIIVQNINYKGYLWCEHCSDCVLKSYENTMEIVKKYKCLNETYICDECHEKLG